MMRMWFELKPATGQYAVQYKPTFGKPTTQQVIHTKAPQWRPQFGKSGGTIK